MPTSCPLGTRLIAVSYTHLDVYKRQLPLWYIPDSSPSRYSAGHVHCRYAHCVPDQISGHCEADCKRRPCRIYHYVLSLSIHISPFFNFSPRRGNAAKLPKVSVSVTDSTQYHMAKRHITGQWLPPLTC